VKISVVLPVYNGERFLTEALLSLRRQSLPAAEVIAIDDGSTDGSAAVLAAFPEVRIVRQPNAGCAVARNRGVALATHETIAFLDQDDVLNPERLERSSRRGWTRRRIGSIRGCSMFPSMASPPAR